jgi:gustatory receptor
MAAQINDSSKYPIKIIKSIPPEGWCIEMQRFADEVRTQTIALSGMRFFYLTRKSILAVWKQK